MKDRKRPVYSDIARMLGISRSHASRLARGLRNPSISLLERAKRAFNARSYEEALRILRGR